VKLRHILSIAVLSLVFVFGVTFVAGAAQTSSPVAWGPQSYSSAGWGSQSSFPGMYGGYGFGGGMQSGYGFGGGMQSPMMGGNMPFMMGGNMPFGGQASGFGATSMCASGDYLYILQGNKIIQYSLPDLTLVKSVDLPKPEIPANFNHPQPPADGTTQPPAGDATQPTTGDTTQTPVAE
jgi:hypothetical protein